MEEELDLRPYIEAIFNWWREIGLVVILFILAAAIYVVRQTDVYEATVLIATTRGGTEVNLAAQFEDVQEALDRNSWSQRLTTFANQVKNPAIAQELLDTHPDLFTPNDPEKSLPPPSNILNMVKGEVLDNSDTILITVISQEPDIVATVANFWGAAFVTRVNETYKESEQSLTIIDQQVKEAHQKYQDINNEYLEFIGNKNLVDELQRQKEEKELIIQYLSAQKQTIRETLVTMYYNADIQSRVFFFNKSQDLKRQILNQWFEAEQNNQLQIIKKDRDYRNQIFDRLIELEIDSKMLVLNQQANEFFQDFEQIYNKKDRYEDFLTQSQIMLNALEISADSNVVSNDLALQILKTQLFALSPELPANIELQFSSLERASSIDQQKADLQAIISVLEEQITLLDQEIEQQSQALRAGNDYQYLDDLNSILIDDTTALSTTIEARLLYSDTENSLSQLERQILNRYADLYQVGSLAQNTTHLHQQTPLYQQIEVVYKELIDLETSSSLINLSPDETDLGQAGRQILEQWTSEDDPLNQYIKNLETEIRSLQQEIRRINNQGTFLKNEFDLAWETYTSLVSRQQELIINADSASDQVRFAVPAVTPTNPRDSNARLILAVASILGLGLSIFSVFILEYLSIQPLFSRKMSQKSS